MSRRWLVAIAAASACGGQPRAPASPADYLGAIRIDGNRAIASDALEPALALHEAIDDGVAIDPYLLALDTDRIRAAYLKRGFFAVSVAPAVEPRPAGGQIAVFRVVEGKRAVARVAITGLPPEVSPAAARALVELADGAAFDYDAYDAAKQPLTTLLEDAGYARAEIRGAVDADPAAAIATVRYEVVPGARCAFGSVRITGALPGDLAEAVRARVRIARGDRYSSAALAAAEAEIYELGRFASVRVVADRSGTGPSTGPSTGTEIDVAIDLVEASRHEYHVGFGLGIEPVTLEARVLGGFSLVPAAARLYTIGADARVALTVPRVDLTDFEPKLRLLGSVQRIDLWWPRLRGELEGGLDFQTLEAFAWAGAHVRLGLGSPLGPSWLQGRIGWVLEGLTFTNINEAIQPKADAGQQVIDTAESARNALGLGASHLRGAYQGSVIADLRDDRIEPHHGGYVAITGSVGTPWAGGDTHMRYTQISPEARGYVSFGDLVVAIRARAGAIYGDVPVTERYYSGGVGQRGFSERYLSPRVVLDPSGCSDTGLTPGDPMKPRSDVVIGGAGLLETGIELRRPIEPWGLPLGANLFLDGADVRCKVDALRLAELQWAVGAGLWGKLGGLKIRGDVGYRLNRKGLGELTGGPSGLGDFAWHIGLGEAF